MSRAKCEPSHSPSQASSSRHLRQSAAGDYFQQHAPKTEHLEKVMIDLDIVATGIPEHLPYFPVAVSLQPYTLPKIVA
jgi:hypothetical protein